jgi:hypothetical protein
MVDRYTKVVLTIIAGSLLGLLFQNSFSAKAQSNQPIKVVICEQSGLSCAGVTRIGTIEGHALLTVQE